jgi:hypothetical protein
MYRGQRLISLLSVHFAMLYFFFFAIICLLLAAIPDKPWQGVAPLATVAGLYVLCFCFARWSRAEAWQQRVVVGAEEVEMGFFGDDGSYFVPTYQGEQTWQLLLLGLPSLGLAIFSFVRRTHNGPIRLYLKWLFLPYGVVVMHGTNQDWFPGPIHKPAFGNPELTTPAPFGIK